MALTREARFEANCASQIGASSPMPCCAIRVSHGTTDRGYSNRQPPDVPEATLLAKARTWYSGQCQVMLALRQRTAINGHLRRAASELPGAQLFCTGATEVREQKAPRCGVTAASLKPPLATGSSNDDSVHSE
jgi:hypothetical protein